MPVKLKHSLDFISLTLVYASNEISDFKEKEVIYAKLDSVMEQCCQRDMLVVLGDCSVFTALNELVTICVSIPTGLVHTCQEYQ